MAQRAGGLYGGIHFSASSALPLEQIQAPTPVPVPIAAPDPIVETPSASNTTITTDVAPQSTETAPEASAKPSAGIFSPFRVAFPV